MFQEAYRQEVAAEEDVHRTLPFFATALSLLIAAINYVAGQLPSLTVVVGRCPTLGRAVLSLHALACAWPEMSAAALILVAALLGIAVLCTLALAVARRRYARVGPENADLGLGKELMERAARRDEGVEGEAALDRATLGALRVHLIESYAGVVPHNRAITDRRYAWRDRAVLALLWSLLCVVAATIIIFAAVKLRPSM
jgi:hypothetical protein